MEQEVNILNQGGESLAIQMGETDLGVVVHNLDESKLTTMTLTKFRVEPVEESFLFIPKYIHNIFRNFTK